jgi:hypothetical protein
MTHQPGNCKMLVLFKLSRRHWGKESNHILIKFACCIRWSVIKLNKYINKYFSLLLVFNKLEEVVSLFAAISVYAVVLQWVCLLQIRVPLSTVTVNIGWLWARLHYNVWGRSEIHDGCTHAKGFRDGGEFIWRDDMWGFGEHISQTGSVLWHNY